MTDGKDDANGGGRSGRGAAGAVITGLFIVIAGAVGGVKRLLGKSRS